MKKKIWRRGWFWVLAVVLAIVLVVHFMLAIWVRDYVNRKLSEIPGYRGHVAAVTLHLWRGAYEIHKIEIKKKAAPCRYHFFPRHLSIFPSNGKRSSTARLSAKFISISRS